MIELKAPTKFSAFMSLISDSVADNWAIDKRNPNLYPGTHLIDHALFEHRPQAHDYPRHPGRERVNGRMPCKPESK